MLCWAHIALPYKTRCFRIIINPLGLPLCRQHRKQYNAWIAELREEINKTAKSIGGAGLREFVQQYKNHQGEPSRATPRDWVGRVIGRAADEIRAENETRREARISHQRKGRE